jgi:hypothetical protein
MILECKHCEEVVEVTQLHHYEDHDPEEPPSRWTFGKCPKCNLPFLALEEDYGEGWDGPFRMYPPREKTVSRSIPKPIRDCYQEALTCFKSKAYTASAIMCRKTLEGLCVHHGVKARSLSVSLKELRDKELIEKRLFEWAEELRLFGNEAAHDVNVSLSLRDSRDIIEFTDALLEYTFTYRDKFEAFKNRRKTNKSVEPTS